MYILKVTSLVLLHISIISGDPCNMNFSAECQCDKDVANRLHVTCQYIDLDNISNILQGANSNIDIYQLNISHNNLRDLPEKYFQGVRTLILLDLSHNSFAALPASLQTVSGILDLTLSHNKIKSLDLSPFANLDTIRRLDVSYNQITSMNSKGLFNTRKNLKQLDLSFNNITSFQPLTLKPMETLKDLNLEGNTQLIDISSIKFPKHLQTVNFRSNGIKKIDYCSFAALRDLEVLELQGNDLSCSCELVSLYQFISRNYQMDDLYQKVKPKLWQCVQGNNEKINITQLYETCSDTKHTESCQEAKELLNDMETEFLQSLSDFKLEKADRSDDYFEMKWTYLNSTLLFGYQIIVTEDGETIYTSPILHGQTVSYTFSSSNVKTGNFEICVQVMRNASSVAKQDCKPVSVSSFKAVIGVLAGVVFLVPFTIILIFIVRTDKYKAKKYAKLVREEEKRRTENGSLKKEKPSGIIVCVDTSNGQTENTSQAKQTEQITHTVTASTEHIAIDIDNVDSTTVAGLDNPAFSVLDENKTDDDIESTEEDTTEAKSTDSHDDNHTETHTDSSDSHDTDVTECHDNGIEITSL